MVTEELVTLQLRVVKSVFAEEHTGVGVGDIEAAQRVHDFVFQIQILHVLQPLHHSPVPAVFRKT